MIYNNEIKKDIKIKKIEENTEFEPKFIWIWF